MARIAFVTCETYPGIIAEDVLAAAPLRAMGHEVFAHRWDVDPVSALAGCACAIVRTTWNYYLKPTEFLAWLDAAEGAGVRLFNPPAVVRWNANKRYLMELYEKGVAIPKSVWLKRGSRAPLSDWLEAKGVKAAVVKPAISAGGHLTAWYGPGSPHGGLELAQGALDLLLRDGDAMVQEFLPEIATAGEVSLLFFGGELSHAVRKTPAAGNFLVQEKHGGRCEAFTPSPELVAQARRALELAPANLLYARVDGVLREGKLLLMELEAIEPALFLAFDPASGERFARAVAARL